jgi:hypothetical protein
MYATDIGGVKSMKFVIMTLVSAIAICPSLAFAGTIAVDLFRSGNSTNARMDNVRITDIEQITIGGIIYVKAGNGGISTSTSATGVSPTVWKIAKGTSYPDTITVFNDKPGHWAWRPTSQMTLDSFTALMASMHSKFVKN